MSTKLEQAISEIKAGNKQKGREIIAEIIKTDRGNEQAWLWLTQTDITHEQKMKSLQQVLRINPNNEKAKLGLAKLQGGAVDSPSPSQDTVSQKSKKKKRKLLWPILMGAFLIGLSLICIFSIIMIPNVVDLSSLPTTEPATPQPPTIPTKETWDGIQISPDDFIAQFNQKHSGFIWKNARQEGDQLFYQGITEGEFYQKVNMWTVSNSSDKIGELTFFFKYPNDTPEPLMSEGIHTISSIISIIFPEWSEGGDWAKKTFDTLEVQNNEVEINKEGLRVSLGKGRDSETSTVVAFTIWDDPDLQTDSSQIEVSEGYVFVVPGVAFIDGRDIEADLTKREINIWKDPSRLKYTGSSVKVACKLQHGESVNLLESQYYTPEERYFFLLKRNNCQGWLSENFLSEKQEQPIGDYID